MIDKWAFLVFFSQFRGLIISDQVIHELIATDQRSTSLELWLLRCCWSWTAS